MRQSPASTGAALERHAGAPSSESNVHAHFDPISGASGDMILGALLDAGAPLAEIERLLSTLPLPEFRITAREVRTKGFRATKLEIHVPEEKVHRHLSDIERMTAQAQLSPRVKRDVLRVFGRLAEAEGAVHGVSPEKVHFHEVGALDSILDVVGSVLALDLLGVQHITFSTLHDGFGSVRTAHGEVPVPVPAVLELTRGLPIARVPVETELLTPTGAAILTTLGTATNTPALVVQRVGTSTGTKEFPGRANVLRVSLGHAFQAGGERPWKSDEVVVLETNLDDMTPEVLGDVLERAPQHGALDAFVVPCLMKKGRMGHLLTLLVREVDQARAVEFLLRETSTFGVRTTRASRSILDRESRELSTPWGTLRIKLGQLPGGRMRTTPEFESCREISRNTGIPLLEVYRRVESFLHSVGNSPDEHESAADEETSRRGSARHADASRRQSDSAVDISRRQSVPDADSSG